jgi:hypothetical protein
MSTIVATAAIAVTDLMKTRAVGASRLYPVAEFSPRQDEALGRRYLQGRYGGVPVLNPAEFERAARDLLAV